MNFHKQYITEVENMKKTKTKEDESKATLQAMDDRHDKYIKALEEALQEGAKYKDLLQMDPKDYGLPTQWVISGNERRDQYTCILEVIAFEFLITEPSGFIIAPNPRSIAEEMEAPYSVIMDAYNFVKDYF